MADRRMFAKTIIDSDAFLDMPHSTQLLYFHLSMRADDEGFINNPKAIMRNVKCSEDDLRLLATKKFIIPFESGIVVIKHWKIHNYIAKDRFKETKYKDERATLSLDENNSYTTCIQPVYKMDTQDRLGKDRLGKDNKEREKEREKISPSPTQISFGRFKNVYLTDEQYKEFKTNHTDADARIDYLSAYMASKQKTYPDHYATLVLWADQDKSKRNADINAAPQAKTGSQRDYSDEFLNSLVETMEE